MHSISFKYKDIRVVVNNIILHKTHLSFLCQSGKLKNSTERFEVTHSRSAYVVGKENSNIQFNLIPANQLGFNNQLLKCLRQKIIATSLNFASISLNYLMNKILFKIIKARYTVENRLTKFKTPLQVFTLINIRINQNDGKYHKEVHYYFIYFHLLDTQTGLVLF